MIGGLKHIVREPLTGFFLLGAVVFGLHAILDEGGQQDQKDHTVVDITSDDIEWLRSNWNKRMRREPTVAEQQRMVEGLIREEILCREATSMGLDQNDSVLRRRLAQKMEFLFKDLAEIIPPTDEELTRYLADHSERYIVPAKVSFIHVYFNPDSRGRQVLRDVQNMLQKLKSGTVPSSDILSLGDPFLSQSHYRDMSSNDINWTFGSEFAEELLSLGSGDWCGPLESSYGLHLVFIDKRTESRRPDLAEVRKKVETDFLADRRDKMNTQAYAKIRSQYKVLVENLPYEIRGCVD
ncbi:MAG: peptidyl-prolyl cis-trans isomerase [Planctomycetota bacterium]|jgi:hypothetical protein